MGVGQLEAFTTHSKKQLMLEFDYFSNDELHCIYMGGI